MRKANEQTDTLRVKQRCGGVKRDGTQCARTQHAPRCTDHTATALDALDARKQDFLRALAEGHGTVVRARRSAAVSRTVAYEWRKTDPDFAAAWQEAVDDDTDELEACASERAKGWKEPILDKTGAVSGYRWKYSDRALEILLKARRPAVYRDRIDLSHGLQRQDDEPEAIAVLMTPGAVKALNATIDEITSGESANNTAR